MSAHASLMLGSEMTRPLASRLVTLEVVGDPEPLAGGIVHLPGGLLRVLQLGNLLFDLPEFNLDLTLEVLDFYPRLFERIFVEFRPSTLVIRTSSTTPLIPTSASAATTPEAPILSAAGGYLGGSR